MTYTSEDRRRALCAGLHTLTAYLLARAGIDLWMDCGKSCGASTKPSAYKPVERPRGAR